MTIFVNRKSELKALEDWFKKGRVALIIGRRRIGKSRLLSEFIKNKKFVYLLAVDKGYGYNLRKFSEELSKKFNIPGLRFRDFEEMFEFLEKREEIEGIAIDEFGYLVKAGAAPEFQKIIDTKLKKKKLILTGSLVSLMESRLIGYRQPLYGRVDLIKRILPLKFIHLFEWFPRLGAEDLIKIYSVTGGVPKYLEFFKGENVDREIEEKMFNPDLLLFRDARLILEEELPEPARYMLIMESIAHGKNKMSEISSYSKIEINQLPYYLGVLKNLRYIIHEKPVIGKKKGIYKLSDNYFTFWFKFISPFFEEIEAGMLEDALSNFRKNFNPYLGFIFEDICKEFLVESKIFPFTRIGRWWHKDKEIDIVALNEQSKEILFGECKWQSRINAEKIVRELVEKAEYVNWNKGKRKESFVVFAKSFSKRIEEFDSKPVYCFDLRYLEKVLRKS